jgi:Meiotically up-regulated gene 113
MERLNSEPRICPKCKAVTTFDSESKTECPKCRSVVWFYDYRPLKEVPPPAEPPKSDFWSNPTTVILLGLFCVLSIVALASIGQNFVLAAVCSLIAIGCGVFAFVRHAEAHKLEKNVESIQQLHRANEILRSRLGDAIARHGHLLATGDKRVEVYYKEIVGIAVKEKETAAKLRLQSREDREAIAHVEERIHAMARYLVADYLKGLTKNLRPDPESYQQRKVELTKTFDFVKSVGYDLPKEVSKGALEELKQAYKEVVYQQRIRDDQKRINQQMRDEAKIKAESERIIRDAENKEWEIQQRLDDALRDRQSEFDSEVGTLRNRQSEHDSEIEELRQQLLEAQERSIRAKSMAELTKAGHVYVLSNIGSLGEGVFKVGMTRRLDPNDRVKELGDASVPFPFDVHVMISCENAPQLENALHRQLASFRVNRINLRKEYFRVDLNTILATIRNVHGQIDYVAEPEALQYRQGLDVSPEEVVEFEQEMEDLGVSIDDPEE